MSSGLWRVLQAVEGCGDGVGIILDPMPRRVSPTSTPHRDPNLMGEAHPPSTCKSLKGLVLKQTIEILAGPGRDTGFTFIKCSVRFVHAVTDVPWGPCYLWGFVFVIFAAVSSVTRIEPGVISG